MKTHTLCLVLLTLLLVNEAYLMPSQYEADDFEIARLLKLKRRTRSLLKRSSLARSPRRSLRKANHQRSCRREGGEFGSRSLFSDTCQIHMCGQVISMGEFRRKQSQGCSLVCNSKGISWNCTKRILHKIRSLLKQIQSEQDSARI